MGKALTSVLAGGVLRAISHWQYNMCIATQGSGRRDARRWVTSGVLIFLDKYRRRAVRAHIALAAMAAVPQRRGELFPPTEGEHDVPLSDSESDSTMSQEHSEAVYKQRMRDTASAVQYATSVALLKATWRMYTVKRAMKMGKQHIPTQKGMRRYRSLAKANRLMADTAKEAKERKSDTATRRIVPTNITVEQHLHKLPEDACSIWVQGSSVANSFQQHVQDRCEGHHDLQVFGMDHMSEATVCHNTVVGPPIYGPEPGLVTVFASTDDGQRAPGAREQSGSANSPIQISDSDETTLADDEAEPTLVADDDTTVSDVSQTESDDEPLLPEAVMQAHGLVSAALQASSARQNNGDPEVAYGDDLRTTLLQLSKAMNSRSAYQQVTVRFPTESQASWEARGAAMLAVYADYPSAMQARLKSPSQEDARWRRFGNAYVHALALLQLDTVLMHEIWPSTSGGETSYRSMWRTKIKQWSRAAALRTAELHDECLLAKASLPDSATMALREDAVQETKMHWSFLYDAMRNMCPPTVVIAAAEAALRVTAKHWHFAETTAMEAVIAKVEARLPLTFKDTQLGVVLTALSPEATNVVWHHMKNIHMQKNGTSSHVEHTRGKYEDMATANVAWSSHYARRMVKHCQRRSNLIGDATRSTASEVAELFAELDNAKQHGMAATSLGVADEAGDVWYGAR